MNLKRMVVTSTAAVGIGAAGLLGLGVGTASADPGQPCGGPNPQACQQGPNNGPGDWQQRGMNQGRQDHQPFNWNGQWVQPMPAGNGAGWGFWFLGRWIPL